MWIRPISELEATSMINTRWMGNMQDHSNMTRQVIHAKCTKVIKIKSTRIIKRVCGLRQQITISISVYVFFDVLAIT